MLNIGGCSWIENQIHVGPIENHWENFQPAMLDYSNE